MSLLFDSNKWVEYMCSYCGAKSQRREGTGRPQPGSCPRRPRVAGKPRPHVWVTNRKY